VLTDRIRSRAAGRPLTTCVAALLAALTLSACGGSDAPEADATIFSDPAQTPASPTTGGTESMTVTLSDFDISPDEDNVSAGTYVVSVVNDGSSTHDLVIERDGSQIAVLDPVVPGRSGTLTVTLEPGEYVVFCSIANHRAMGMETTIEVT
jgi:plastocyanin